MVSIIDYGAGNIGSILNMFKKLGCDAKLVSTSQEILESTKLVLPGVGHFDFGMNTLNNSGMIAALHQVVLENKVPILGICLGAQLMAETSDEGVIPGLGWFQAKVKNFRTDLSQSDHYGKQTLRVPHMGWNHIEVKKETPLTNGLDSNSRFYFVHSYYIQSENENDVMFKTDYGLQFDSGLNRDNIYAVQFHPEKSHKFGLRLLENFMHL